MTDAERQEIELLIARYERGCGIGDALELTRLLIRYFRDGVDTTGGQLQLLK